MFSGLSGWTKIIFIASLVVNFIILGTFASHYLGWWRGGHGHGLHSYILKEIPEGKREQVSEILSAYKEKHPFKKRRFYKNWPKFEEFLRKESFDRLKFIEAYNQAIELHNERWIDGGNAIADIAELLSPEERIKLLDQLKKKWKHRRGRRHRRGSYKSNQE